MLDKKNRVGEEIYIVTDDFVVKVVKKLILEQQKIRI